MTKAFSPPGFILLDENLQAIAFNDESIQILGFPVKPERIQQPADFLSGGIRSKLLQQNGSGSPMFVNEYQSGARQYVCRAFQVGGHEGHGSGERLIRIALLLERRYSSADVVGDALDHFELTPRELEMVRYLVEGLTSKEIAVKMEISPNTVKAFLRSVMIKMDVTTRSGVVGRAAGPHAAG